MLMKTSTLQIHQINSRHMENPFIQTKHHYEIENIAIVYVSHVLSATKFDYSSHAQQNKILHTTIGHCIAELNQAVN